MPLSGAGNRWTDHVRAFATKHKVSYMCAMSNPACSAEYKGVKPAKAPRAKKGSKKEARENISMGMEDIDAPARKESLGDIFESTTPIEGSTSANVRSVLKNKGSLNKALNKKLADQQGMLAEDINRVLPDTKGKAKKTGRPKKYADPEEARKAKITNTIRRAKERVVEKKDARLGARVTKAKEAYANLLGNLKSWYGNGADTTKADWYKGNVTASNTYNEYVDKILKKFKGVNKEDFVGGSFNVSTTKTGGMMGWVKSIIGRHPQLTPQQIRDAERFADELMADPRGVSFEGASVIPAAVRKELSEEAYNRTMMGKEDKDAPGDASDVFADEIRKQALAPPKSKKTKPVIKGRTRGERGGANALQKGMSAEMRSYVKPPLQHDLNQIIHSNDAPASKFGATPNAYRDHTNSFDAKAQKQIDRAIAILVKRGIVPSRATGGAGDYGPWGKPPTGMSINPVTPGHIELRPTWSGGGDIGDRFVEKYGHLIPNNRVPIVRNAGNGLEIKDFDGNLKTAFRYLKNMLTKMGHMHAGPDEDEVEAQELDNFDFNPDLFEGSGRVGRGPPIFTADWRGPVVQQQRTDAYNDWSARQGGSVLGDYGSVVKHLMSHITDPKEPIDPRDFAQAIHLIKGIKRMKGGYLGDSQFDPYKYNPNDKSTFPESKKYDWNFDHRGFNPFSYNKWSQTGGADPREANTPSHNTAIGDIEPPQDDWDLGGIDWGAIGEALQQDALDNLPGVREAELP